MKPSSEDHKNYIIKLYLLDKEAAWRDLGKGYLHIQKLWNSQTELEEDTIEILLSESPDVPEVPAEKLEALKKNVPKDFKDTYLLRSAVKKGNEYEKQTDKVVTWVDKDLGEELAISFLDSVACNETWRLICNAIGKNPHQNQNVELSDLDKLVLPSIDNLDLIISELQSKIDWNVKAILEKPTFLKKLKEVFQTLEDLEQTEELTKIYKIFKMLVFSNDVILIELLMTDLYYQTTFGAFEYDEENVGKYKQLHRGFLRGESKMHVFEDFLSKEMEKKVRINFRLSYLRDSVLASKVDESLLSTLNAMLYYNNFELIYYILSEKSKLSNLIDTFSQSEVEEKVNFFSEFFTILKNLQGSNDLKTLLNDLITHSSFLSQSLMIFATLKPILFRSKILENMLFLTQYNPEKVLAFLLSKKNEVKTFFQAFTAAFLICEDEGFQIQSCEFIIFLLDPTHDQKTEMFELVFEEFMGPLWRSYDENNLAWIQYFIEILVFCVSRAQGFRIRQYLIQNKVFQVLLKAVKLNKKTLTLAIIKLFKAVLLSNDEVLVKYIYSNNHIIELAEMLLLERRGRSSQINLVFSCCLELIDIIYQKNLKKFIKSICENDSFTNKIQQNQFLKSFFAKIFIRFEQYKEVDPFGQTKQINNKLNNDQPAKAENELELKENKNLEELAYFENEANEEKQEKNQEKPEVLFNQEELKERKEHLLVLQNKIKRKLENPQDEGLVVKKINTGTENGPKKISFAGKIDIVFQEKETQK